MDHSDKTELRVLLEIALNHLDNGGHGSVYDPSWIRPKTMTRKEMEDACIQAYHAINKALEMLRPPF